MQERRFSSFLDLSAYLQPDSARTFTHRWQDASFSRSLPETWRNQLPAGWDPAGQSGQEQAPKYLYRGEPDIYPSSQSSRGRLESDRRFSAADLAVLDKLTSLAAAVWNRFISDRFRSVGWPQHYGFPTNMLDLTTDARVALHFAALPNRNPAPRQRTLYRLDLEAIQDKIYAPAGGFSPLAAVSIEHTNCTRATRQHAWVLCSREDEGPVLNFQDCPHLDAHVERFVVDAEGADAFLLPGLLTAEDDAFASWPLAVVRALKLEVRGPLPRPVAEWIAQRIPLFEWTPVQASYDGAGRGSRLQLLSPSDAQESTGRNYAADLHTVIDELTSDAMPIPNGILFGRRTGGRPGTSEWLEPGREYEFQLWHDFPDKEGFRAPFRFQRLVVR